VALLRFRPIMMTTHPLRVTMRTPATIWLAAAASIASGSALAGAPFLTDDPVPVDRAHSELQVVGTYDHGDGGKTIGAPGLEYDYGGLPETQFHISVPFVRSEPTGGPSARGLGDIEVGIKYRLMAGSATSTQVAIFPSATLATGDAARGLGNGKPSWRLPVWIQQSWGDWTTDAGAGYAINHAEGQKSYPFGGWLVQKAIGESLSLGGEIFAQGSDTVDGHGGAVLNLGGSYKIAPNASVLFSAGRSVSGAARTVAYLSLWWTWGGDEKDHASSASPPNPWAQAHR
jgi:outer membrane putative beta-barrel porin/alpha-amylase